MHFPECLSLYLFLVPKYLSINLVVFLLRTMNEYFHRSNTIHTNSIHYKSNKYLAFFLVKFSQFMTYNNNGRRVDNRASKPPYWFYRTGKWFVFHIRYKWKKIKILFWKYLGCFRFKFWLKDPLNSSHNSLKKTTISECFIGCFS